MLGGKGEGEGSDMFTIYLKNNSICSVSVFFQSVYLFLRAPLFTQDIIFIDGTQNSSTECRLAVVGIIK